MGIYAIDLSRLLEDDIAVQADRIVLAVLLYRHGYTIDNKCVITKEDYERARLESGEYLHRDETLDENEIPTSLIYYVGPHVEGEPERDS